MKKVLLLLTLICFIALPGYCLAKDCKMDACHKAGVIPPENGGKRLISLKTST